MYRFILIFGLFLSACEGDSLNTVFGSRYTEQVDQECANPEISCQMLLHFCDPSKCSYLPYGDIMYHADYEVVSDTVKVTSETDTFALKILEDNQLKMIGSDQIFNKSSNCN